MCIDEQERGGASAEEFIREFSGLSGWGLPSHALQYIDEFQSRICSYIGDRLGLSISGPGCLVQPLSSSSFDLAQLLRTAERLIESFSHSAPVAKGQARRLLINELAQSIASISAERTRTNFFENGLRASIAAFVSSILEQRFQGLVVAARLDAEPFTSRTELLRTVWFLYPYIFFFLAHLSCHIDASIQGFLIAYTEFMERCFGRVAEPVHVKILPSDFHAFDLLGFEVLAAPSQSFVFKHRPDAGLEMLLALYSRCLAYSPALYRDAVNVARPSIRRYGQFSITRMVVQQAAFTENELHRYYAAAGALVACATALDVVDLHYENLIASAIPVPIDVESIFYWSATGIPIAERGSVLASGLLPFSVPGSESVRFDLSAFGCIYEHTTPLPSRELNGSMKPYLVARPTTNRPMRQDGSVASPAQYRSSLTRGFKFALEYLAQNVQYEANLIAHQLEHGLSCRTYNEPSAVYDQYIRILSEPLLLSNVPALKTATQHLLSRPGRLSPAAPREMDELMLLGIPRTLSLIGAREIERSRILQNFCQKCVALSETDRSRELASIERSLHQAMFR